MKTISIFLALALTGYSGFSQLKVGLPSGTPAASAVLDASNTGGGNKGFLGPQVALTAINAAAPVTAPATGLMVYNTATAGTAPNNVVPGYYYWNATQWVKIVVSTSTAADGNIYSNDGTLSGDRTVTTGAANLTFSGTTGAMTVTNNTNGATRTTFQNINTGAANRNDINIKSGTGSGLQMGIANGSDIFGAGSKAYLDNRSGGRTVLGINGNEYLTVATNGNVGVGAVAPATRLAVQGSISTSYTSPVGCACVSGTVSLIPATTTHFTLGDGDYSNTVRLPATATEGQIMIISSRAAFTSAIEAVNTNLGTALSLPTSTAYLFVYVKGGWLHIN